MAYEKVKSVQIKKIVQKQIIPYLSQEVERLKSAVADGGVRVEIFPIVAFELKYGLGLDESNIPELGLSA